MFLKLASLLYKFIFSTGEIVEEDSEEQAMVEYTSNEPEYIEDLDDEPDEETATQKAKKEVRCLSVLFFSPELLVDIK